MRSAFKVFLVATIAVLLAACRVAPNSSPTAPAPPASVPTILPTPSSVVRLEDRLLATISVGFPDELVYVQGSVWVKTDDGHLVRIDPATNSVVGAVKVDTTTDPYHYCQGLGADGDSIWVCSAGGDEDHRTIDVVRIDPASMTVVATIPVDKSFDQFAMPVVLDRVWVLSDDGAKLIGIDSKSDEPGPGVELGARCFQVAAQSDSLLLTCKLDDLILRVDPVTLEVTERYPASAPGNIVAAEDGVWVAQGTSVARFDPDTLTPVAIFDKLGGADLFLGAGAVWVRLENGFLYRIDPANNEITEQVVSDQREYNMGGIVVTADSIWTSAGDDDLVLRISP